MGPWWISIQLAGWCQLMPPYVTQFEPGNFNWPWVALFSHAMLNFERILWAQILTRWTLEPGLAQRKASREVGRTGQPPKALRCLGKLEGYLLLLDMHGADYLFCWVLAHCRESIEYLFSPNMSQVLLVADAFIVAKTFFSENWLGGSPGNVAFISMNKDLMVILKP